MKLAVAADHAGYTLKTIVVTELRARGHEVLDLGTDNPNEPDDYPDVTARLCEAVRGGRAERGILVCGSGVGACVVANKFPGIRAGLCHDHYSAHQAVEHDDVNVLCLGGRIIGPAPAIEIVHSFVAARFSNEERHVRRLTKLRSIEGRFLKT